jgi:hypothetical protein
LVEHVRVSALVQPPPTNTSIADLPHVELAWRSPGELVARGDAELGEDLMHVVLHRAGADEQLCAPTSGLGKTSFGEAERSVPPVV